MTGEDRSRMAFRRRPSKGRRRRPGGSGGRTGTSSVGKTSGPDCFFFNVAANGTWDMEELQRNDEQDLIFGSESRAKSASDPAAYQNRYVNGYRKL